MLKIFNDHDADASIMDDFSYYDEREKGLQERKANQQPVSTKNASDADSSLNLLSENFAESLQLEDDGKQVPKN